MKKGFVLLLFLSNLLLFTPSIYASLSSLRLDVDPCEEIAGGWKGTWKADGRDCLWNAQGDSSKHKDMVRFIIDISLAEGSACVPKNSFVMMGTCKDGVLDFDMGYKGYIFGGIVTLHKDIYAAILKKQA